MLQKDTLLNNLRKGGHEPHVPQFLRLWPIMLCNRNRGGGYKPVAPNPVQSMMPEEGARGQLPEEGARGQG